MGIQIRQRPQRNILAQWMHRQDHIRPPRRRTRRPIQAFSKGIKADHALQKSVQPQTKGCTAKFVKQIPQDGILGGNFVEGRVVGVRPSVSVIRVEIDNVTLNLSGIQNIKSIAEGIGRSTVSAY